MISLSNGQKMPSISLGTYKSNEIDLKAIISSALDIGYRAFDTASSYTNEGILWKILDKELQKRLLTRESVYIITKLRPKDHGYNNTIEAIKKSANNLGGYIDMFLIHWPGVAKLKPEDGRNKVLRQESWNAMIDMYTCNMKEIEGQNYVQPLVRGIGVSNYQIHHLEEICNPNVDHCTDHEEDILQTHCDGVHGKEFRMKPMVNQIEIHLSHHPLELISYCKLHGIQLQAYSPYGAGGLLEEKFVESNPECKKLIHLVHRRLKGVLGTNANIVDNCDEILQDESIMSKQCYEQMSPQERKMAMCNICVSWLLHHGYAVVPKTSVSTHLLNNSMIDSLLKEAPLSPAICFPLTEEEFSFLDSIHAEQPHKYCWDSSHIH